MKHKALVKLFSQSCKVPEKTVALFARNLKEVGLLTTGKRGAGAPEMTADDLARLVVAFCATDRPAEVVELTHRYCAAICDEEIRINLDGKEAKLVDAGVALKDLLAGTLQVPTQILVQINPSLTINWNTRTAVLRLCEADFAFKVAPLSTDDDLSKGIVTTRMIDSDALIEMALPFFLENQSNESWEVLSDDTRALRLAVRKFVFGVTDDDVILEWAENRNGSD